MILELDVCIVIENGIIVAKSATSEDLKTLDHEVVDSVRFRFAEKNFFKKTSSIGKDINILKLNTSKKLYESGEELLSDLLSKDNYQRKTQLKYLAEKHEGKILKIQFVLSPFAFVFLIGGGR
ncbi:hypothetical protein H7F33_10030 [Pedobacter sp. PAMC26386]|nr:hypothetical protein H7F33_10030 [Pedobacter sp. PAMC26386]